MSALRRRRVRLENDPEIAFANHTYPLRRQTLAHLAAAGVPLDLYPMRTAAIAVHRNRFYLPGEVRCPDDLVDALIFSCVDPAGHICDLAAFVAASGESFTWLGCAWTIDETVYPFPLSAQRNDGAIELFRSPLEWLRHDMRGLVVLDPIRARWQLLRDGAPLIAQNLVHARDIKRMVSATTPSVLLPLKSESEAA